MNLGKGFFRLTLVLSVLAGIVLALTYLPDAYQFKVYKVERHLYANTHVNVAYNKETKQYDISFPASGYCVTAKSVARDKERHRAYLVEDKWIIEWLTALERTGRMIPQLKQAGFTDEEIRQYFTPELRAAGFSEDEINNYLKNRFRFVDSRHYDYELVSSLPEGFVLDKPESLTSEENRTGWDLERKSKPIYIVTFKWFEKKDPTKADYDAIFAGEEIKHGIIPGTVGQLFYKGAFTPTYTLLKVENHINWVKLVFVGSLGFALVWFVYAFVRWIIVGFIVGGFKDKK